MKPGSVLAIGLILMARLAAAQTIAADVALVGGRTDYIVVAGDTLTSIGARFGVDRATLIELNQLARPGTLTPGQTLILDNRHLAVANPQVSVTINIAQRLLVLSDQPQARAYPVTVGRRTWPTPVGAFTIISKEVDPVWDVPISIQREMEQQGKPVITRMEPSPQNPLGQRWIGLSLAGIGIHGTNAPSSIYAFGSHGCVRMHPDDVADLFERVSIGTTGVLIYQPVIIAAIDGRIWLEAHPDAYRRAPEASSMLQAVTGRAGLRAEVDWEKVKVVLSQRRGLAVDVTGPQPGSTAAQR
jgi:L,D-transpeptidase ErfK/SrfK